MDMIRHQCVGVDVNIVLLRRCGQCSQECVAVRRACETPMLVYTTLDNVHGQTWCALSRWPWHSRIMNHRYWCGQPGLLARNRVLGSEPQGSDPFFFLRRL